MEPELKQKIEKYVANKYSVEQQRIRAEYLDMQQLRPRPFDLFELRPNDRLPLKERSLQELQKGDYSLSIAAGCLFFRAEATRDGSPLGLPRGGSA